MGRAPLTARHVPRGGGLDPRPSLLPRYWLLIVVNNNPGPAVGLMQGAPRTDRSAILGSFHRLADPSRRTDRRQLERSCIRKRHNHCRDNAMAVPSCRNGTVVPL